MQLTINRPIVDALKTLKDVPDNLRARIDGIAPAGSGWLLKLSDDDGTMLAELLQWHMKTDPATGKPTQDSAAFNELVRLIDEAQFS
jgi:hypothetical protein